MWTDRVPPPRATRSKRFQQSVPEAVSKMASQWGISFKSTFLGSNSDLRAIDHSLDAAWIQFGYMCKLFNGFSTRAVVRQFITVKFFISSEQYKNAHIANFINTVALEMNKTNEVCKLECNPVLPTGI